VIENLSNLPEQLRQMSCFLLWRAVPDGNKIKKVPFYASGQVRNGLLDTERDFANLVSFNEACDQLLIGGWSGLGFAAARGICGFDIDKCLDAKGRLLGGHAGHDLVLRAKEIGAYIEISPSGRGLLFVGPSKVKRSYSLAGVEYWGEKHFLTLTGRVWANSGGWVDLTDLRSSLGTHTKPVGDHDEDEGGIITPRTIDELRDALSAFPSHERELWVRMGMALKGLDKKGKALWLEWSARSKKFVAADAERVWESFEPNDTDYRAVFAEAQRNGWKNPRSRDRAAVEQKDVRRREQIDLGDKPDFHPNEFILDGFMPIGVSVIAGAWGAGKSTNLIPLMASVAHLAPDTWGFRPDLRRHVIWITEAPEQARDTLLSLHKADGSANWSEFREWFHLFPAIRQRVKDTADELRDLVASLTWSTETGFKVKPVVVLDTTTANIELENESDNSQVGAAMSALKQSLPATPIVLIGHTPKALLNAEIEAVTFRGAGAWEAEAAATYFLVHDAEADIRFMAIRKARFTPTYREVQFDHQSGTALIDTPWGAAQTKTYLHGVPTKTNGEARRAARQEVREERRAEENTRRETERRERVLATIRQFVADGRLPKKNAIHQAVRGDKTQFYEAVNALIAADLIYAHPLTKDDVDALGLKLKAPWGDVLLPAEVVFPQFLERVKENQQ
jgi:hypothetical protein